MLIEGFWIKPFYEKGFEVKNMVEIDMVNSGLDVVEGVVWGGLAGFGADVIGGAVSALPGAFLTASAVTPLAVVVGALVFVGYAIPKIRSRIKS